MDWKKIILALYLVCAIVGGIVFGVGVIPSKDASAQAEPEVVTSDEDKEKIIQLENQLDDLARKLNSAESERAALEVEKEDLTKEVEELKAAAEAAAKAQEAKAREDSAEESEDAESEEDSDTDEDQEKKKEGPYYTYKINTSSGPLRLYNKKSGGSSESRAPKGYKGYVIDMGSSGDHRALILFKGELYYASKSLLKVTEIDAEDYPDKVAALSADDIGEKFFRGKAVGIEKDN